MDLKKIRKLMLAFALVAALFVSAIPVSSAEENSSPKDVITDEVDDSTIDPNDGGGTGSGNNTHTHDWKFMCIWWDITNEGEMIADARYRCKNCLEPNTDDGDRIKTVSAVVEKTGNRKYLATVSAADSLDGKKHTSTYKGNDKWEFDGFNWGRIYGDEVYAAVYYSFTPEAGTAGYEYKITWIYADVTEVNGVYTATVSAADALDGVMRTEVYAHTHKWVFDRIEWDEIDHTISACGIYHCDNEDGVCQETREVEATVDRITGTTIRYRATITSGQSPDGKEHVEIIRPSRTTHDWIFDGFEWDLSEYDCIEGTGAKATALYHCRLHRSEHCEAEASIRGTVSLSVMGFNVSVSSGDSPDGKAHSDTVLLDFYPFKGAVFQGFEWDTSNGVKAYAVYRCETGFFKGQQIRYPATVTRMTGTVAPMYKAEVPAVYALDNEAHSATKTIITPPSPPGPITPWVKDDLIGPPKEMKPGADLIAPIGELTPANP